MRVYRKRRDKKKKKLKVDEESASGIESADRKCVKVMRCGRVHAGLRQFFSLNVSLLFIVHISTASRCGFLSAFRSEDKPKAAV